MCSSCGTRLVFPTVASKSENVTQSNFLQGILNETQQQLRCEYSIPKEKSVASWAFLGVLALVQKGKFYIFVVFVVVFLFILYIWYYFGIVSWFFPDGIFLKRIFLPLQIASILCRRRNFYWRKNNLVQCCFIWLQSTDLKTRYSFNH